MDLVVDKVVYVVFKFVYNSFKVDKIFADIADAKIYIGKKGKRDDCMYHYEPVTVEPKGCLYEL
ncbi:hypothetical protein [Anaerococcus marasmi]|uniref:hypothetical protein n=1 Tax=Anaerococcus marasmi TaxID=2057797 RepID=UPI000CF99B23|nr:hypothetical protein [Anaerococcus marasmi]